MKFTQIALAAFLAIASIEALALPNPSAIAKVEAFCNSPGQPCHKVKRVAEALAEPVAGEKPSTKDPSWCWLPGEVCLKKRRIADPPNAPNVPSRPITPNAPSSPKGTHPWCWLPGSACAKAKRQLEELEPTSMKL